MIYVTVVKVSVYFDIILKSFPEKKLDEWFNSNDIKILIGWSFTNCVPSCGDLKLNFVETARYDIS